MTDSHELRKLQISLRWAWVGPAAGIACMIALFITGLVTQTPGMTVAAATLTAAMAGMWVGISVSLRRKITRVQRRAENSR